jgi:hypothetical protein
LSPPYFTYNHVEDIFPINTMVDVTNL